MRGEEFVRMKNQSVGVYYAGQDFALEPPAFFVEREVARQWLDDNVAWSIHHGRDIALQPEMEEYLARILDAEALVGDLLPEDSCIMGERVMNANADERIWARMLMRSWNPQVARMEHLRSLKRCRRKKHLSAKSNAKPVTHQ